MAHNVQVPPNRLALSFITSVPYDPTYPPTEASHVEDGGYLKLGKLKGNVGNQNYPVPAGTNITEYNSVVIWCELFGVLFSPAALTRT